MFVNDLFEKKKPEPEKPRNFVAKNAKMGGAGAHKDKKKADKQGDVKHKKDLAADLAESNRGYDHGFASPTAPSLKGRREFDEPDAVNNIEISINGRPWKVFAGKGLDSSPEFFKQKQMVDAMCKRKTAETGKKWSWGVTGAPATNEAKLATQDKENRFKAIKQRDQQQDQITHQAMNNVNDEVAEGKKPDNYHIVNKDGKPASLASYADQASAVKDRDAKHPGAEVRQVGPRGKVKGVAEGVAETLPMSDAVKVLKHYGAEHFKTGSESLKFYKDGRAFSVDLIWNDDATRSVSLSQLNSATRGLKGQGVAEGSEQQWTVTVGTKTGGTSHTMTFTGTKEQAIKKAVARFGTSKNPVVNAVPAKQGVAEAFPNPGSGSTGSSKEDKRIAAALRKKHIPTTPNNKKEQGVAEGFNFNDKNGRWEWDDGTSYDVSQLTPAQKERVAKWKAANSGKRQGRPMSDTRGENTPHGSGAGPRVMEQDMAEGSELKQAKRKYNQAAKDANADQVGAGKKIDTMKNSLRQRDLNKQGMAEVAPPGAKAERMVKHIKKGYAKDGKITPKEKSIAYATAWKAHNKEINEEIEIRIIEMRMNGYEL